MPDENFVCRCVIYHDYGDRDGLGGDADLPVVAVRIETSVELGERMRHADEALEPCWLEGA
jgi:hypothetical protein